MLHPGRDLLANIASLLEIHAVQPFEARLENECIRGQLNAGFRDQVGDAQRGQVGLIFRNGCAIGPPTKLFVAGVGMSVIRRRSSTAMDMQGGGCDSDIGAEFVH